MEGPLKVVIKTVPFFSPIYRVRRVVSKERIKSINPIRVIGLIRSSKTVCYKVSRRIMLPIGSAKYIIGRHLGNSRE